MRHLRVLTLGFACGSPQPTMPLRPCRLRLSMQAVTQARLQIHFCVLLWGFTAILGKLITLPALPLV